jgi:hypothetical protein
LIDPTRAIKGRLNDYSAAIYVLAQKSGFWQERMAGSEQAASTG